MFPNVIRYSDRLIKATEETFIMVGVSAVISIILGLLLGILVVVTAKGNIYENKPLNEGLSKFINAVRSIPFVILIALILPFTKLVVGTSIGIKGAIVPMIIGITPFIARQIEQALLEVDKGIVEAALSMGFSKIYIIRRVILREAKPAIVRGIIICIISLINLSAMAGSVGGGGLGDFAIRYGYSQYMTDITVVTVLILLVFVFVVQSIGTLIVRKMQH